MGNMQMTAEPGKQEIFTTYELNAPRELVFKVMTDPSLVGEWWGPASLTTVVEKMDVRPGGQWRVIQHDPAGTEYAFHGVFHSLKFPETYIYTFEWEAMPDHVLLEIYRLEALGSKTRVIEHTLFQSVADRDGMLATGMEAGAVEMVKRLEKLLARVGAAEKS
ncbi:uncharacterized conserved protein [Longilinea arvoryzae]|uniref:Uncharacterized conserved protein n=1 Tax=Longilinea arvoryzae TaxID=360412 RepID=A0A0S7BFX9_9CHLR|nr:SRPBCC family protein [Longilinea arvoryzae]GAP13016.1 uncharacterized conserved protein [Longilinea arvoryzae]